LLLNPLELLGWFSSIVTVLVDRVGSNTALSFSTDMRPSL